MRVAFSPHYSIQLVPHHQFPMEKYRAVHATLLTEGVISAGAVQEPEPASSELLQLAHTADYVSRFLAGEVTPAEERLLGFPWSPELARRALYATGGTLLATRFALEDGLAANLAGGSHHAFADHGEGYCAFNDLAVAVRALRQSGAARRIAVIDCDVHQGNGTAAILGGDPSVFTFSVHCDSNYPRQKIPGTRDVGLPDGVEDPEYLAILSAELDAIWQAFRPDFVFYQAGVDPLAGDRLGRLRLTLDGLRQRDELVLRRCRTAGTPVVVVLGGGYGKTLSVTVNAHAQTVRVAANLTR